MAIIYVDFMWGGIYGARIGDRGARYCDIIDLMSLYSWANTGGQPAESPVGPTGEIIGRESQ